MAIIDELVAVLGYDVRGEDQLRRFNKSLDGLQAKAEVVGRALGSMAAVAGAAVAAGMGFLGKSVLDTSAKFETYLATLETIEGSADKANKALDWISNFAQTTPYEVDELTAAFVKLRSYGLDPMDGSMTVLGDTAAGMGKSIDQVVEAIADASTFQFERLRELGLVASQAGDKVTFSWTENGKSMSKTINKTSAEVTQFISEVWDKKFGGAMIRQSKTWTGMMSNLGDSWTNFQRKIGEAGFFETVKNKLADLMDLIAKWQSDGTIDKIAQMLSGAFTTAADAIGWVVGRIGTHMAFLSEHFEAAKPWIIAVGVALGALFAWAFPVVAVFVAIGLALDDFLTFMEGGESVIGSFIDWIKQLPQLLADTASAFTNWLGSINWGALGRDAGRMLVDALVMAITGYVQGVTAITQWLVTTLTTVDWGGVGNAWMNGTNTAIEFVLGVFAGIADRVAELIKKWFDIDLKAIGEQMGQQLLAGLQMIGDQIKAWFMSLIPDWAKDWFSAGQPQASPGPNQPGYKGSAVVNGKVDYSLPAVPGMASDLNTNIAKMNQGAAAVVQDNTRNTQNVNVNAPVEVHVQQAIEAPAAVGDAISNAVTQGTQPARMQNGSAF